MKLTNKNQEEFNIKNVRIGRTRESFIMAAVTVVLLIVAWIIALARHQFSGPVLEEWQKVIIPLTLVALVLIVVSYFPQYMNQRRKFTNMRQVILSVRLSRVLAIEFALLTLVDEILRGKLLTDSVFTLIPVSIFLITALIYMFLINRAK